MVETELKVPNTATDLGRRTFDQLEAIVANSQKNSKISKQDLELIKILGVGAYGKVALVRHKKTNKRYAMKSLKIKEVEKRN